MPSIRLGLLAPPGPGELPEELRRLDPIPRLLAGDAGRLLSEPGALRDLSRDSGPVWVSGIEPSVLEGLLMLPILALLGHGRLRFEPATTVVRTAFLGPDLSVLNWSVPAAFREPDGRGLPAPVPAGDWEPLAP
jgi:hypothetical protein